MKLIDVGVEPVGIIAIGQNATGVVAIGQLATGVFAVGQLARGVFVVGQLAIGVAAFGQLCVALTYGGGMLGVAGLRAKPSLVIWPIAGDGHLRQGGRWRPSWSWHPASGRIAALRIAALAVVAAAVAWIGLSWFPDFVEGEPGPPPVYEPGTR